MYTIFFIFLQTLISDDLRLVSEKIGMLTMHYFYFVINLRLQIYCQVFILQQRINKLLVNDFVH